jgi:hypothetical protein
MGGESFGQACVAPGITDPGFSPLGELTNRLTLGLFGRVADAQLPQSLGQALTRLLGFSVHSPEGYKEYQDGNVDERHLQDDAEAARDGADGHQHFQVAGQEDQGADDHDAG